MRNALPPCRQMTWHYVYSLNVPVFHVSVHETIESLCVMSREPAVSSSLFRLFAWGSKVGVYAPRELTIAAIVLAPGLSFVLPGVLNGATLITGPGIPWRAALSRIIGSSSRCRAGLPWTVEIYGPLVPVRGSLPMTQPSRTESNVLDRKYSLLNCVSTVKITFYLNKSICCAGDPPADWWQEIGESGPPEPGQN